MNPLARLPSNELLVESGSSAGSTSSIASSSSSRSEEPPELSPRTLERTNRRKHLSWFVGNEDTHLPAPVVDPNYSLKLRRIISSGQGDSRDAAPSSSNQERSIGPTKIDFQKHAVFNRKQRLLIISGEYLFIYKQTPTETVLERALPLEQAKTERPNQDRFKLLLNLASGSVHKIKFKDEGTLALFKGHVQQRSQPKVPLQKTPSPVLKSTKCGRFVPAPIALELLRNVVDNQSCAECGAKSPTHASTSLGIVLCKECASIHTTCLTSFASNIRSIADHSWPPYLLNMMLFITNSLSNSIWEHALNRTTRQKKEQARPTPESPYATKVAFVRAKYDQRLFLEANYLSSKMNVSDSLPNMGLNAALKGAVTISHFSALVKLIAHDISPNTVVESESLLHLACMAGNVVAVTFLLENGANPDMKNAKGLHPLDLMDILDKEANLTTGDEPLLKIPLGLVKRSDGDAEEDDSFPPPSTVLTDYGARKSDRPIVLSKSSAISTSSSPSESAPVGTPRSRNKAAMLLGLLDKTSDATPQPLESPVRSQPASTPTSPRALDGAASSSSTWNIGVPAEVSPRLPSQAKAQRGLRLEDNPALVALSLSSPTIPSPSSQKLPSSPRP